MGFIFVENVFICVWYFVYMTYFVFDIKSKFKYVVLITKMVWSIIRYHFINCDVMLYFATVIINTY